MNCAVENNNVTIRPRKDHNITCRKDSMEKEILTIKEAAGFLQISNRSLYKLAKQGRIPCKKILNKWRFEKESLKSWVRDGISEERTT